MNMEHHQVMRSPKQEHQKPKYRFPENNHIFGVLKFVVFTVRSSPLYIRVSWIILETNTVVGLLKHQDVQLQLISVVLHRSSWYYKLKMLGPSYWWLFYLWYCHGWCFVGGDVTILWQFLWSNSIICNLKGMRHHSSCFLVIVQGIRSADPFCCFQNIFSNFQLRI